MEEKIPKHVARLTTIQGFVEAYWERLPEFNTNEEAYDSVERQYVYHYGQRKYSDYNSFRQCYRRYLEQRQNDC